MDINEDSVVKRISKMATDMTLTLQHEIKSAAKNATKLRIQAGNSKAFYGRKVSWKTLDVSQHQGIINYQPTELVMTAKAGTSLAEIEKTLAEKGQMLAFEPPYFGSTATLGGTIACGFSGPRRPFTGSARDFMLGCKIINGKAEVLSFGGEVMKNVAGYDVSRLMVGAMGTLGVLLEISLKVLPSPAAEQTRCFELDQCAALNKMLELAGKALPLSGLSYDGTTLYVRLSGAARAVSATGEKIGGELLENADQYWLALREHRAAFFKRANQLWRLSVPSTSEFPSLEGKWYHEWGGALRWLISDQPDELIFSVAAQAEGHATLFRGKADADEKFQPLSAKLLQLNQNLKQAFDPKGILNSQRMFKAW